MEAWNNHKKFGHLHYLVKLDDGYIFKRHINQLRSTSVPHLIPKIPEPEIPESRNQEQNIELENLTNIPENQPDQQSQNTPEDEQELEVQQNQIPETPRRPTRVKQLPKRLLDYILHIQC